MCSDNNVLCQMVVGESARSNSAGMGQMSLTDGEEVGCRRDVSLTRPGDNHTHSVHSTGTTKKTRRCAQKQINRRIRKPLKSNTEAKLTSRLYSSEQIWKAQGKPGLEAALWKRRKKGINTVHIRWLYMYILITFNDINKYNYVAKDLRSYIYLVRKTLYPDARSGLWVDIESHSCNVLQLNIV